MIRGISQVENGCEALADSLLVLVSGHRFKCTLWLQLKCLCQLTRSTCHQFSGPAMVTEALDTTITVAAIIDVFVVSAQNGSRQFFVMRDLQRAWEQASAPPRIHD